MINVTAKSKCYIGSAPFTASHLHPDITDYEAQTWVEIGEISSLGTWGAKGKEVTASVLNDGYMRRLKGTIDSGTVELVVLRDPFDAGQIAAVAASKVWTTFPFKVELNDAPNETGTPTDFYFLASVMSAENKYDNADTIIETTFSLGITGQITEVTAAAVVTFSPVAGALPGATSSVAYTETVAATGGIGVVSYAVSVGTLPAGLTLNAATGAITGTTTAAGSHSFSISAVFSEIGDDVAAYTLLVS
jgi:Putative Ig domain